MSKSMRLSADEQSLIWVYRLALALLAGNPDAYADTVAEIAERGCWACVVEQAIAEICGMAHDRSGNAGVCDTEAAIAWMQKQLDDELYRIEIEQ